jgi:predicted amidophosphoribosyltransferase
MIDLSKTFLQCLHCHHHFSEPRHVCPSCDWPRSHSDETPPPTWSQPDPNAAPTAAAPQIHQHLADIKLEGPVQLELPLSTEGVSPVPQLAPAILADIPIPQSKAAKRQAKTLTLAPELPTESATTGETT